MNRPEIPNKSAGAAGEWPLIVRLFRDYVGPRKSALVMAILFMAGGAATTGLLAWILDPAVKLIFLEKRTDMLLVIPGAVVIVVFLRGAFNYGDATYNNAVGQGIVADTQRDMFRALVASDLARLNAIHSAQFVSNFIYDATLLREAVTKGISGLGREFLLLLVLAGVMFYQNWRLTLLSLVVLPVIAAIAKQLGTRMRQASNQSMIETGELSSALSEMLDGRRIVKAYGLEAHVTARADARIARRLKYLLRGFRARALSVPVADFVGGIAIAAVVLYAGYEGIAGRLELNQFASFLAAMLLVQQPVRNLSQLWTVTTEGMAAAERVFNIIDGKPSIVDSPTSRPLQISPPPVGGQVTFRNLHFSYPGASAALNGISLEAKAGQKVALVGPSGAGKSTIFNLLLRFYEAGNGQIEIDRQNIRDASLETLRSSVALVTQESFLFDESVAANIACGRAGATQEEIISAATNAAAHDFIVALPNGYDTIVGEGGLRLSGGQRQRIAIARAMLRDAPILLLDEATSALDTENERLVQGALKHLMRGRTTLVIAHRLSTVLDADCIYVLDNGRVVEQGRHEDLIARGGLYTRLYQHDLQEEIAGSTANVG